MIFHVWEKWHVQSKATVMREFRDKFPAFYKSILFGLELSADWV